MNKRVIGTAYEKKAAEYLISNGIENIIFNYRCHIGEIDLIGYDKDTLVFFEVKFRSNNSKGYAAEAVNRKKQVTICRVSDYFRMINKISDFSPMRYDVIAIDNKEINWLKNAFEYIPRRL